jgi:hypothetical protein
MNRKRVSAAASFLALVVFYGPNVVHLVREIGDTWRHFHPAAQSPDLSPTPAPIPRNVSPR